MEEEKETLPEEAVEPVGSKEENFGATSSYPPPARKRNWKKLLYLLGFVILIVVLFNVFRTLTGGSSTKPLQSPTPTPTPIAKESPTPTPTTSSIDSQTGLDRADLKVAVQNGSGEGGVAAKASNFLKNLGYNVTTTGNADKFDYIDVTVKIKSDSKKYLPLLVKDLSANYTIGASSSDLSASSSADALVIIGK